ncbi:MAG: DUF2764 family protein, partial [Chitinophagales bacterium]
MHNKGNNTYYALVTSLPFISLEQNGAPDYRNLATDYKGFLSERDYKWLQLVYCYPDLQNFINRLISAENEWVPGGNFDADQIAEAAKNKWRLFGFQDVFFTDYNATLADKSQAEVEKYIMQLYYMQLINSGNNFLQNWGRFAVTLNNYIILLYAEYLKMDLSDELIILPDQHAKPIFRILEQELNEHVQTAVISD